MSITIEILKEKCKEFREEEGRASFYDIAAEILDEYPLHASIIILATWNMGRFRFFVNDPQNLINLKKALEECMPLFEKIKEEDFKTVNFDEIGEIVKLIYSKLSAVKGSEYTGSSKIIHLLNKNLFVMWDTYIRKGYKKKYGIPKGTSGDDFLKFQKLMQKLFGHIKWDEPNKTLPKAIDENNYIIYTLPELRKRRKKRS